MQVFGNVATAPVRRVSKTTSKGYYEFRLCENKKGQEKSTTTTTTTWYSVRKMVDSDPGLRLGDFCKVSGTLKVDPYVDRMGKPAAALLIIAFEAVKLKGADELQAVHAAKLAAAKEAVTA
mgnify:CR=1 FL=1